MSGYGGKNCGRLIIKDLNKNYVDQVLKKAYKRSKATCCYQIGKNIIAFREYQAIIIMPDWKYQKVIWLPQDFCFDIPPEDISRKIQEKFNISIKMIKIGTCIPYEYFIGRNDEKIVIAIKGRFNTLKVKLLTI